MKRGSQLEAEEAKSRERRALQARAARKARWRVPLAAKCLSPPPVKFDASITTAGEGAFPLDAVVRKLLDAGRIRPLILDGRAGPPFPAARILVQSFAEGAREHAETEARVRSRDREDAKIIVKRLDELLSQLSDFVEFTDSDIDDGRLFYGVGGAPPEDERKPWVWMQDEACAAIEDARKKAASLRDQIAKLRDAAKPDSYAHDGNEDIFASSFLSHMAMAWGVLTGERPGRSGRGLFRDFCVAAWAMAGQPKPGPSYFTNRLERGVHLRLLDDA